MDMNIFRSNVYSIDKYDETVERYQHLGRVYLAVLLEDKAIDEVILNNVDIGEKCCTLGIHPQNDGIKNKGFETQSETLAFQYAINKMGLETVYADAIHKNKRSQHVLEKAGFQETHRDDSFIYYRCDRSGWSIAGRQKSAESV